MIEFFQRQFRRLRRFIRFAAVLLRGQAEFKRLQRSGGVSVATRVQLLQGWCRGSLAALDVQVTVEGIAPTSGLLASNHLSYLDILVYSSVLPCAFVSKAEVRGWLFFGQFAEYGATIFVQREDRAALAHANQQVVEYLKNGVAVVLFPEGTTTDGARVLRFHSSMLQPAIEAAAAVTPCAISYEVSGGDEGDVAWWGDLTLGPHAWNLLGKQSIRVKVVFGNAIGAVEDRKKLSDMARVGVVGLRAAKYLTLSS